MIIACHECGTRYAVPDTAIGAEGRTVRCANCKHSWFQEPVFVDTGAAHEDATPRNTAKDEVAPPTEPTPPPPEPDEPTPPPPEEPETFEAPDTAPSLPRSSARDAMSAGSAGERAASAPRIPSAPGPETQPPPETSVLDALKDALREEGVTGPPDASSVAFDADPVPEDYADPLAADDLAPDESVPEYPVADDPSVDDYANEATPFDDDFQGRYAKEEELGDEVSHFEYRAPFTTQRNPVKMWSVAAAVFALMATGTIAAVNYYGLPAGLPFNRPTFGIGQPDLVLDFPEAQQGREVLPTSVEIFRVRGTITNEGASSVSVPNLVVVFEDESEREVYSSIIVPAKSELAPGESLKVTEAVTGYPPSSYWAKVGWAPR